MEYDMKNEPDWLKCLKEDVFNITKEASLALWPNESDNNNYFYNYRLEHIKQVERDAIRIIKKLNADKDIVIASVWIHDRFQPSFTGENHGLNASQWAEKNLSKIGFPESKIEKVSFAVKNHSNPPHTIPENNIEARVLWDADKLSHIGSFEIITKILNSLARDYLENEFYHNNNVHSIETIQYIYINSLKGFEITDGVVEKFYYDSTKAIAKSRIKAQSAFIKTLKDQLSL